jgi:Pentapeptide repeats (8 copies)
VNASFPQIASRLRFRANQTLSRHPRNGRIWPKSVLSPDCVCSQISALSARRPHELIAMGRIVELPSIKPRTMSPRRGLRKLSPDLISKARDETAAQVTRIGLTFLGTAAFCLLSLLSSDSALLGGSERINVPFAGPVSFFGFMLLGPAVLIALRVYLQIYVEHGDRLDQLARSVSVVRAPTLVPLQNTLIRLFSGLIFYLLMPVTMMLFAWKAAVFPRWGSALFGVAVAVIASHVMLPLSRFSWRSKGLLSVSAAIIAGGVMLAFGPLHRPFDLYRANLSGGWLQGEDLRRADLGDANLVGANLLGANLRGANLVRANLSGAHLSYANLSDANLVDANLRGADLSGADLSSENLVGELGGANLLGANLSYANLSDANLSGVDLSGANLSGAINLTQTQLDAACGNSKTKLPEGLTIKPCSTD